MKCNSYLAVLLARIVQDINISYILDTEEEYSHAESDSKKEPIRPEKCSFKDNEQKNGATKLDRNFFGPQQ